MRRAAAILIVVLCSLWASLCGAQVLSLKSPDGRVEVKLLADQPRLRFTVSANGTTVIEPSPIVCTVDGVDIADGVALLSRQNYAVNEEYPTFGVHSRAVNYCDGVRQTIRHNASGQEYTIDVRAYHDGAAFRIIVPGGDKARVPDELTSFTLPAGTTVWSHDLHGHYEGVYEKKDIAAIEAGTWHAPPVTCRLSNGAYAMITEAALVNYSGMALESDGQRGFKIGLGHRQPVSHPYELRYTKADIERLSKPAAINGPITTPWRVVILAADLNALVNCDLVTNLNPPPDKKLFPNGIATNWIEPGRAVWRYLDNEPAPAADARGTTRPTTQPASGPTTAPVAPPALPLAADVGEPPAGAKVITLAQAAPGDAETPSVSPPPATAPATTRASSTTSTGPASRPRVTAKDMKLWSELAGKLGFEYSILEGFWASWPDDDLKDLVTSARALNVGIFVWVDSKKLHDPEARKALYKRCVDAGVVGLKVDFFDHEHKETIDLYQAMLKEAAENKLLLDFHGADKPTGTQRTWPNELTREAVRGMEARKIESRATHETTLPFTRFVVGPAEYTGTLFTERRGDTTFTHQIAIPVVFTTPLMTYAAHPQKLIANPATDVIRQIPTLWDQTIVLPPSEIGEIAVYARHRKDQWFLGVLNGKTARELKVPLSFLNGNKYTATFVRDGAKPQEIKVEKELPMSKADTVTIDLPAGGGFVGVFTKKEE